MNVWRLALSLIWLSIRGRGGDEVQLALDVPTGVPAELADGPFGFNWTVTDVDRCDPTDRIVLLCAVPDDEAPEDPWEGVAYQGESPSPLTVRSSLGVPDVTS